MNLPSFRAIATALLGVSLLHAAAGRAEPPVQQAIYSNATVIDGTGAAARHHQDIVVADERIVAIVPHGSSAAQDDVRTRHIDLSGRFVIPGLIDSHVHMATPPDPAKARAQLRRDLYGGVTAVRDMADDTRFVAELAREARYAEIPAPDIALVALFAGRPFFADPRVGAASKGYAPGTAPWMQAIDAQTDLSEAVTLARGTGATAIKIYADLPRDLIAAITREAHRQHMLVWAHSAVFPTRPADVIDAGVDTVSHVCYLAYQVEPVMLSSYEDHTPVHEDLLEQPEDPVMAGLFADMVRRGTILDATGSLFVRRDAERAAHPERKPLRCTGPATTRLTRQAWRAGVPISTGTDSVAGAESQWPDVFAEIEFLVREVGMPPLAAIHSATEVGARAMGRESDMGTLEPAKLANFVVLSADPVADIGHIRSVELTVKRGHEYRRADYRPVTAEEMGGDDED
ncbi:hydrolase [Novosphingobium sp. PC22D]|uniref:amidohydrolase family protein n=1 Tax=Novosphingobium sp. PC22D TaxID=1962403 RepID=UPI000BEF4CDF|nr:amidohydrolase family protein [Novosphingobium sp. PC22D]PEQ12266.1 hydrolase [Novosphingobium sp. PC22D]